MRCEYAHRYGHRLGLTGYNGLGKSRWSTASPLCAEGWRVDVSLDLVLTREEVHRKQDAFYNNTLAYVLCTTICTICFDRYALSHAYIEHTYIRSTVVSNSPYNTAHRYWRPTHGHCY